MRSEPTTRTPAPVEIRLEAACLGCGGPLEVRIDGASCATYCRACHWISRPSLHRNGPEILLAHSPAGLA